MKTNKQSDQRGMVSILITMVMMIVITLIVIGFTHVAQRNARESLDSQLGTQAYYAAETGVNDVITSINEGTIPSSTSCSTFSAKNAANATVTLPRALPGTTGAANTCLMVNAQPSTLKLDSVGPGSSKQLHLQNSSGTNFGSLTFAWTQDLGGFGNCPNAIGNYPVSGSWNCTHAILRVDILKGHPSGFDAATLADNTASLYLQPIASGGSPFAPTITTFPGTTKAYQGSCIPTGGVCSVTVSLGPVGSASQDTDYYIRLSTIYEQASQVTISATSAGGGATSFANGQYVIDSTGRAQDQLKRIQVRVPYSPSNAAPAYAVLSTNSVCKDLAVTSSSVTNNAASCPSPWPNP